MHRRWLAAVALLAFVPGRAAARSPEEPEAAQPLGTTQTFIDHTSFAPFWFGAEVNTRFILE